MTIFRKDPDQLPVFHAQTQYCTFHPKHSQTLGTCLILACPTCRRVAGARRCPGGRCSCTRPPPRGPRTRGGRRCPASSGRGSCTRPLVHLHTYSPVHLYTCTPVHLYTCTTAHLYTYSPVHGDLLQVQLAEAAQLHLLGPHVHTEVASSSLQVESAVREELEMSGLFLLHPSTVTWLMSRGSMGEVSPVSPAASVVLPPSPEESSLVICKARSGQGHRRGHTRPRLTFLDTRLLDTNFSSSLSLLRPASLKGTPSAAHWAIICSVMIIIRTRRLQQSAVFMLLCTLLFRDPSLIFCSFLCGWRQTGYTAAKLADTLVLLMVIWTFGN